MNFAGRASEDVDAFKEELSTYWFGKYSRSGGVLDSSGFEHVFQVRERHRKLSIVLFELFLVKHDWPISAQTVLHGKGMLIFCVICDVMLLGCTYRVRFVKTERTSQDFTTGFRRTVRSQVASSCTERQTMTVW